MRMKGWILARLLHSAARRRLSRPIRRSAAEAAHESVDRRIPIADNRAMRWRRLLGAAPLLALVLGCHTLHFQLADPALQADEPIRDRKSYLLFGLVSLDRRVDVSRYCPYGVAAIREQTSFVDGLITFPLLGLWSLRSSWYYCLQPGEVQWHDG